MAEKPKGPPPPPSDRDRASASGIPLQRHLAELVRRKASDGHLWRVEAEEIPAGEGFLDMLLGKTELMTGTEVRAAVEVKRFYDVDASRPMRLLFLATRNPKLPAEPWAFLPYMDVAQTRGPGPAPHRLLADKFVYEPHCPAAEHCIFEERKGSAGMDAMARELLGHMEALSLAQVGHGEPFAFVPMIVTNAELRVLHLTDADLTSGAMTGGDESGVVVPWLRYEKTLSETGKEPIPSTGANSFQEWAADRVRTVFVVQAQHFIYFLARLRIGDTPWKKRR